VSLEGILIDITEQKRAEEALRKAENKYRSIFENAVEGIFQTSVDGRYLIANNMLARIYGYESVEDLLLDFTDIKHQLYVNPNRRNEFMNLIQEQGAIWGFESEVYCKDGTIIWISENSYGLYNSEGKLIGYEGTVVDITERKRSEEMIQYQAFHDLLTSLPNRVLFNENLLISLESAPIKKDLFAVMFLDLDRFKKINDTLGHAVGDRLLQNVAQRLKSCLREGDIVARWGGDEFTILLPQINCVDDPGKIAQRIIDSLKLPFYLENQQINTSTSIGIALYPDDGLDVDTLLKNADTALYEAKKKGRNNYQFYLSPNHQLIPPKIMIQGDL
jgi:diguanylate cyclase (GGDEF)-like protein/PAS domain S-box-containing protein